MKKNTTFKANYAVSEIVGGMILVTIAVISFSVIYIYLLPPGPECDAEVRIDGYVNEDGIICLKHMGGNSIDSCKIVLSYPNGTVIGSKKEYNWDFGEYRYPLSTITDEKLESEDKKYIVNVYKINEDGKEQEIFIWEASGRTKIQPPDSPILISSLKTNSVDEDLICYSYSIGSGTDVDSYIYNWQINDNSFYEILMPFDTEDHSSSKDYSNNNLNAVINDLTWTSNGKISGAYEFKGMNKYLTLDLPNVFNNIGNNDFSISFWIKNDILNLNDEVVFTAIYDDENFVKFFIIDKQIHFGVCYNNSKDAVKTNNLSIANWYHITGVWDADEKQISLFCNRELYNDPGERNFELNSGSEIIRIGNSSWEGTIDELQIFDRNLSYNQISQDYISTKNGEYKQRVIVSDEINLGDIWQCIIIPNDSSQDLTAVASNEIEIVNYGGGD